MRYFFLKPLRQNQAVVPPLGLSVTPASLTLDRVSPGNVANFVASLNRSTDSPVTVSISSSDPSVTVSPASFTLGTGGQISKTITATGAAGGPDNVTLQVTAPGLTTQTIAISRPAMPLSLTVNPASLTLDRVSPGNVASFTASLNRVPESQVLVSVSSSDQSVSVFPASFSLSSGNPPSSSVTLTGSPSGPSPVTISINPLGLPRQTVTVTRPPFLPNMIPGLALWLDASDASTITLDGSNNASQCNDKSGNGRNAVQATAARRPGLLTINGVQALNFDGTDDLMVVAHGAWADLPSYSIYGVVNMANTSIVYRAWIGKEASAADRKIMIGNDGSTGLFYNSGVDTIFASKAGTYANNVPVLISAHKNGTIAARAFVNGAATATDTTVSTGTNTANIAIGAGAATGGYCWPGQVGEILIYDTHHDDTTRGLIEAYLKAKWGTP